MSLRITSKAVLVGYDSLGSCIYSDLLDLSGYYDGKHVWDSAEDIRRLRLERVKGYRFNTAGVLTRQFENLFNPDTGVFQHGSTRYADGTVRSFPPAA